MTLKTDPSYEFIGEVIFKINVVQARKSKLTLFITNISARLALSPDSSTSSVHVR
jgi:hypothetical protein